MNLQKGEANRGRAKLGFLLTAIVTFFTANALADVDLMFDGFVRSYPLSGYVDFQLGYDQLLWGDSSGVLYGYVRPYIEADTAGTYNSALAAVDFFPLSFLGVRAGEEWIQNDTNYRDYACSVGECKGTRYRQFVQAQLTVGYSIWFSNFAIRWDDWTQKHPELGDGIDANSGLAARAGGDTEVMLRGITGFKIDDTWAVVGGMQYFQMTEHFGISRFWFGGPRWRQDDLTLVAGGCYFNSTEAQGGAGVFAGFTWEPFRSLALH